MTTQDNDKTAGDSTRKRMDNLSEEKRRLLEKMMAKERASRTDGQAGTAPGGQARQAAQENPNPWATGGRPGQATPHAQAGFAASAGGYGAPYGGGGSIPPGGVDPAQASFFGQTPNFGNAQGAASNPWAAFSQAPGAGGNPFSSAGFFQGGQNGAGPGGFPGAGAPPASPLIAMKPTGSRPPLFCVHAILGSVFPYHNLTLHMDEDQPFYGLQAAGLDGRTPPLTSIEEMASLYIEEMRKVQPTGPYYLGGYSFGGWVVFEMAQQLLEQGEKIDFLSIFGTVAPTNSINPALLERFQYMQEYLSDFQKLVLNSFQADEFRMSMVQGQQAMPGQAPFQTPPASPILKVFEANCRALMKYKTTPLKGKIDLFLTRELREVFFIDPSLGWKRMCGEGNIHMVSGNHLNTFQEPHVQDLAAKLTRSLGEAADKARAASN